MGYLANLRGRCNRLWLALGDLNEVCSPSEVVGGEFSAARASHMLDMMDACNFIDLGFTGTKFTWECRVNGRRTVAKRLDRALGDVAWRFLFPEAFVEHLAQVHSDHTPLLLRCHVHAGERTTRPFRFQAAWVSHPSFEELVDEAWQREESTILGRLQNVQVAVSDFNKTVFGNIHRRKRRVEMRLQGLQQEMDWRNSESLARLEITLQKEYGEVLHQEEMLWYQKSRENWVHFGDRNTKFFHAQTIVRRKRNKIHGLYVEDGTWCTDPVGL